jgi:mono/diheme cytochrome c family protein
MHRAARNAVAIGAAAFAFAALARAEDQRQARGEELYHQYCGACHGISGDGQGPVAVLFDPRPADLRGIAARRKGVFPEAEILRIIDGRDPVIAHGTRDMPVWGERFQEHMDTARGGDATAAGKALLIIDFLKTIQKK